MGVIERNMYSYTCEWYCMCINKAMYVHRIKILYLCNTYKYITKGKKVNTNQANDNNVQGYKLLQKVNLLQCTGTSTILKLNTKTNTNIVSQY